MDGTGRRLRAYRAEHQPIWQTVTKDDSNRWWTAFTAQLGSKRIFAVLQAMSTHNCTIWRSGIIPSCMRPRGCQLRKIWQDLRQRTPPAIWTGMSTRMRMRARTILTLIFHRSRGSYAQTASIYFVGGWKMGDEIGTVCGIHTIVGTLNGVVALALAFRTSPETLASDERERRP